MRVVHVINGLTTGGAETVLYRLTTYPSEVEHEVICLEHRAAFSDRLEAHGIRVHHLEWTSLFGARTGFRRLRELIEKSGADVVQAWMYRSNLAAGFAARRSRMPVLWNIRCSSLAPLRAATRMLVRVGGLFAPRIPAAIVNCSANSAKLHAALGYDLAKTVIIPNGYDATHFHPDDKGGAEARERLGVAPGVFLIGSFGRWHPQKGYPVLLRALTLLRDRGIALRLLLVGPGLDRSNDELVRLIERCGFSDLVEPLGERGDIADLARSLDIHVVASVGAEGFPNVVAETMLSGIPNVATDVGDSALIVDDAGWIVAPGDAERLAAAIEEAHSEWSGRPGAWRTRKESARRRIADNFSLDRMVERYRSVWRRVAELAVERRPSPAAEFESSPPARSKPVRVLHIINSLTSGGAEALLYRFATGDDAHEHVIISLGQPAWYSVRLRDAGVPVHHLEMGSASTLPKAVRQLSRLVRESEADVVHCWMYRSNVVGGLIAKAAGKRVVWGIHCSSLGPLRRSSRAVARLGGVLARWTPDFIINCSTRSAELHGKLGYSAADGAVVHNGYDSSIWFPDDAARQATRAALGVEGAEFVIGSIARWDPVKDIPNLLAALRIVHQKRIPFRCFLVGAGLVAENKALMEGIDATDAADLIVPLGPRADVQDLARMFDLHVLASRTEAFPNVVAETMLSGAPNVVTDVGDAPLMVGETGWVVPPRDSVALAAAIIEAYREWKEQPQDWATRREAVRGRIADNFSFEGMVEAYGKIWSELAAA